MHWHTYLKWAHFTTCNLCTKLTLQKLARGPSFGHAFISLFRGRGRDCQLGIHSGGSVCTCFHTRGQVQVRPQHFHFLFHQSRLFYFYFTFICIYWWEGLPQGLYRGRRTIRELAISFQHGDSGTQSPVFRSGCNCLCPLSHLLGP